MDWNRTPALVATVDETSMAYQLGYWTASGVIIILLLWGIIRCIRIMRRPESQPLGPLALLIFLAYLFIVYLTQVLYQIYDPSSIVITLVALLGFVALPPGLILAIIGLVQFNVHRDRYTQGKVSAIWALVLFGLQGLAFVVAMLWGVVMAIRESEDIAPAKAVAAGETQTFEDLNFEFEIPEKSWVSLEPASINPAASLVLHRPAQDTYFVVIAERGGVDLGFTSEGLREIAKGNVTAGLKAPVITDTEPVEHEGLQFLSFEVEGKISGDTTQQKYYVTAHNGFLYQLLTGTSRGRDFVNSTSRELLKNFHLLDYDALCYNSGRAITEPIVKPGLGLKANLHRGGWITWDTMAEDFPEADFGAQLGNHAYLGLVSFDVAGLEVTDEEVAASTLWVLWGETNFPDDLQEIQPFENENLNGLDLRMTHTNSGEEYLDLIRVFQHEDRAVSIIAWLDMGDEDRRKRVLEGFDAIEPIQPLAPEEANLSENQKQTHAEIINKIGLLRYEEGNYEASMPCFETARNLHPDYTIYALNAASVLEALDRWEEAAAYLEKALPDYPESLGMLAALAYDHQQAGNDEKAIEYYAKAYESGHDDEDHMLEYLRLLVNHNRVEEALAAVEKFHDAHGSDRSLLWKAEILEDADRLDDAIALLQERLRRPPFDYGIAYDLAEAHLTAEAPKKTIEICDRIAEEKQEDADVHWLRGLAFMDLERFRDAKASFENALEEEPENETFQHSLARSSAALGEGNNSLVKQELEPVAIPESLRKLLEDNSEPPEDESYGCIVMRRLRVYEYHPEQKLKQTFYASYRITGKQGVNNYKKLTYSFNPFYERVFVNQLRVLGPDGSVLAEGNVNDYYVMDENDSSMATEEQTLHIPVPGLEPGVTLEYSITQETLTAARQFEYFKYLFYDYEPSRYEAVAITGNTELIRAGTRGNVETLSEKGLLAWYSIRPPLLPSEPYRPQVDRFLPVLWAGDKSTTWEEQGRDYLERLTPLLGEPAREITATAARIAPAGEKDAMETVKAFAHHVRNELTYHAIEFGTRGQIPLPASRVLRNRYGDCKDHSLLLRQLLKARGIESHLALANFNGDIQPSIADLDQFDHMILWVPSANGGRFIDCTDDFLNLENLPPDSLAGKQVLILDPANVRLAEIPDYPPEARKIVSERLLSVEGEDLNVAETVTFHGYSASAMRDYFAMRDAAGNKARLQNMLDYPRLRLQSAALTDLHDPGRPLTLKLAYSVAGAVKSSNESLRKITLPSPWELYYLKPPYLDNRRTPFEIEKGIDFHSTVQFVSNAGADWSGWMPDFDSSNGDNRFHRIESDISTTERGEPRITWKFYQKPAFHPAERYTEFVDLTEEALQIWEDTHTFSAQK